MVYVFRHGEAAQAKNKQKSRSRIKDEPHLTSDGKLWVKRVVSNASKELGFKPDIIVSSPLARARETAEIARQVLRLKTEVQVEESLEGERKVEEVYQTLRNLKRTDHVALVSHQPLVKNLVSDLTGGDSKVWVYVGGIACIQCTKHFPGHARGTLVWLHPPLQWYKDRKWI